MPRLDGIRERRQQPFFDTLVRGIGQSTVSNQTQLFGNANVGNPAQTNLQVAGVLAADQTFVIKAIRGVAFFQTLDEAGFGAFGDLVDVSANVSADQARAQDLYSLLSYGAYFKLTVGDKPMFTAPLWYIPAGGGVHGHSNVNNRMNLSLGVPSQEAILKLGKDIMVPARQNFNIEVSFYDLPVLGQGQGGAIPATVSPLAYLNQFDGAKLVQLQIDGLQTRDVQ